MYIVCDDADKLGVSWKETAIAIGIPKNLSAEGEKTENEKDKESDANEPQSSADSGGTSCLLHCCTHSSPALAFVDGGCVSFVLFSCIRSDTILRRISPHPRTRGEQLILFRSSTQFFTVRQSRRTDPRIIRCYHLC